MMSSFILLASIFLLQLSFSAGQQSKQRELFLTRRGYGDFSCYRLCLKGQRGTPGYCLSQFKGGAIKDGETMRIPFTEPFDWSNTWTVSAEENGPRCGGKIWPGFTVDKQYTTSSDELCITTFYTKRSFWRCKTKNTFRFTMKVKCEGKWHKLYPTNGYPDECRDIRVVSGVSTSSGKRGSSGGGGGVAYIKKLGAKERFTRVEML